MFQTPREWSINKVDLIHRGLETNLYRSQDLFIDCQ